MPELRKDPLMGRWVIIATERVRRPSDFARPHPARRGGPCVFCEGREEETPAEVLAYREAPEAVANGPGWRVRVVPNKFPALRIEGDLERRGEGIYDRMNGIGAHEVIIESPDHDRELAAQPVEAVFEVLHAFQERITDLKGDGRFRAVLVFKNSGVEAGATLEHPHSQLIATPVVPRIVSDELDNASAYYRYRERCLLCDMLRQEVEARARLVLERPHVVAFAPFAARFPFETWILPRRHGAAFELADNTELRDVAHALRAVLGRLARAAGDPPYNLLLHSAPFGAPESGSYHWHLEVVPKLGGIAGFELGSGYTINPVPPEDAARFLRETPEE